MLIKMTVEGFMAEVASAVPAPGGGSVSALAGAQAAALLAMYCKLTIGRAKYVEVEDMMQKTQADAEDLRIRLQSAVAADTEAFNKVMEAFKLPKETAEEKALRGQAVQSALHAAAIVPLNVCEYCLRLLHLIEAAAGKGNESAASDIGVANLQAFAGLTGAAYNVLINLSSIKDGEFINNCATKLASFRKQGEESFHMTLSMLEEQLKLSCSK